MVLVFALLLAVACPLATASNKSLGEVIRANVQAFNGSDELQSQLLLLLGLSSEFLRDYDAAPQRLLDAVQTARNSEDVSEVLNAANSALRILQQAAPEDSILAIVTRRALLASTVLHLMADGQVGSDFETEDMLSEITEKVYRTHVETAVRKGILDYLHISKSGGTSFSSAAQLAHCSKERGLGQPLHLGDTGRWINYTAFSAVTGGLLVEWSRYEKVERGGEVHGCKERHEWLARQGLQYISNEYTLFGGLTGFKGVHVCKQGVNMVTLRDPEARLESHIHFMLSIIKLRFQEQRGDKGNEQFYQTFCTSNRTVWEGAVPAVLDNYNIRSFVGEKGFHAPFGSIGQEHLEVARNMLLQFDLVMDLDAGPEGIDLTMQQGLGWRTTLAQIRSNTLEGKSKMLDYDKLSCMNAQLFQELSPLQEPDRQLYRLGRALSFLDRLMLSMSQEIGLEPTRAVGGPSVLKEKNPCGLFAGAQLAKRRDRKLRRLA